MADPTVKTDRGHMFVPENKIYSDMMKVNADIANDFLKVIVPHTEAVCKLITDELTVIADFCAADGQNSLLIIRKIIELIREKNKDTELMIVYEDYEGNDYNALFSQVLKGISTNDGSVFIMASATTMYKQCLPSSSVQFSFSSKGLYYPSIKPCLVTSSMTPMLAKQEEHLLYKKQAEADWKLFLSLRSAELKPGGVLFIIPSMTADDDIWSQLDITLKSLLDDKTITKEEYKRIHINIYTRSEQELRQPFDENAEDVKDLELVSCEVIKHLVFEVKTGSLGRDGASFIMSFTRTFAYHPIIDHLGSEKTMDEKHGIADKFFLRYVENYQRYTTNIYHVYARMVIKKKL